MNRHLKSKLRLYPHGPIAYAKCNGDTGSSPARTILATLVTTTHMVGSGSHHHSMCNNDCSDPANSWSEYPHGPIAHAKCNGATGSSPARTIFAQEYTCTAYRNIFQSHSKGGPLYMNLKMTWLDAP